MQFKKFIPHTLCLLTLGCQSTTSETLSIQHVTETLRIDTNSKARLKPLSTKRPNILWIVTDDQRADSISVFNQVETGKKESALGVVMSPNIDALAKEGVLFTRAYNNSPACAPSRSSMVMGLYPHHSGRLGFERTHNVHDLATQSIPEVLSEHGYQTAIIGKQGFYIFEYKNGLTWNSAGFYDNAFDYKNDFKRQGLTDFYKDAKRINGKPTKVEKFYFPSGRKEEIAFTKDNVMPTPLPKIDNELDILRATSRSQSTLIIGGVSPQPAGKTLDGEIVNAFNQFLDNKDKSYQATFGRKIKGPMSDKPLMINLGFHFPHTPVLPPKSFRDQFLNNEYQVPDFSEDELKKLPAQLVKLYEKMKISTLTAAQKQQAIADYYAFCAYGDHLIGQAIKRFKAYNEKLGKEYVIVLTVGDHGWQLGEQGIEAKFSPWNTSNQGVMIVADSTGKRFPKNKVYRDFVEYVDIAPTIISAAGIDATSTQPHLDGFDLAEVISNNAYNRDYVLGEINHVVGPRAYLRSKRFGFSMRIRKENGKPSKKMPPGKNVQWALTAPAKEVEMALYDLKCDANEQNNVAYDEKYQKLTQYFRTKLQNIILGDGRVEVDWSQKNNYFISDFAKGSDDKKLTGLDKLLVPCGG